MIDAAAQRNQNGAIIVYQGGKPPPTDFSPLNESSDESLRSLPSGWWKEDSSIDQSKHHFEIVALWMFRTEERYTLLRSKSKQLHILIQTFHRTHIHTIFLTFYSFPLQPNLSPLLVFFNFL
ncbi:hypothetical protein RJT34_31259 [Clitoria ternatea]|uniref:Uncharacterized protein n=1 Tax=Clitoria ternatea TaxID=43366 RepID=A0AAN9I4T8_CLITE